MAIPRPPPRCACVQAADARGLITQLTPWSRVEPHLKLPLQSSFELGRGSFGKVYAAFDTKHHCAKAVKVAPLVTEFHLLSAVAEVLALQHLPPHTNLLTGELLRRGGSSSSASPALCVVMPQCLGSVESYLLNYDFSRTARGHQHFILPPDTCAAFSRDLIAAVRHLHSHGVVHGDLSPSNLLVQVRGHHAVLRVGDLGMSRVVLNWQGEPAPRHPIRGLPGGWCTFSYSAPENLEVSAGGRVGFPIDDWSVGAMVSEWHLGWWWTRPEGAEGWEREDWIRWKGKLLAEVLEELRCATELEPLVVQALWSTRSSGRQLVTWSQRSVRLQSPRLCQQLPTC